MKSLNELIQSNNENNSFKPEILTLKTIFADFDNCFEGFKTGEIVVVAGRPAMGKTLFLVQSAVNIGQEFPVLYINIDLSEISLINKFIAALDSKKDFEKCGNNIFIESPSVNSSENILKIITKAIKKNSIKLVVIDSFQNFKSDRNASELHPNWFYELKALAKEINICIVISTGISRKVEKKGGMKWPKPKYIKEIKNAKILADTLILLYRSDYYGITVNEKGQDVKGIFDLFVYKNDEKKIIKLKADSKYSKLINFDDEH